LELGSYQGSTSAIMSKTTKSSVAVSPADPSGITVAYKGSSAVGSAAEDDLWDHAKKTHEQHTVQTATSPAKHFASHLKPVEQLRPLRVQMKVETPSKQTVSDKKTDDASAPTPSPAPAPSPSPSASLDYSKIKSGKSVSVEQKEVVAAIVNMKTNMNTPIRMLDRKPFGRGARAAAPNAPVTLLRTIRPHMSPSARVLTDESEFPGLGGVPRKMVFVADETDGKQRR